MASRPAYGGKTIPLGDITIMDEGEPMTIESTHKPQPSTNSSMDAPKAMRPVLGGKTILLEDTPMTDHVELITTAPTSKPKLIIRSSMNPPTSSATPLGASLRGFGNLGATKPRTIGEKAVPAKATSSNLDFLPDAQPAGIAYCKTWPGSDHPYTEPTQDEPKKSAEQETEEAWKQAAQKVANRKADQEHWTNYRQGVLDGRAKRENECKTDVLRAKNTGGPLLPLLDNGMPQFSVTVTFSLPVPDRTFKGKWGKRNLNRVQGNLQVLIRYKHFGDKFVVWAEPKKARYKDNGQHLDICYETVGFLKSWESAQAKTVRRIRLNEHYKAWKAGTKGVEKSIYRHKNYKEWDEYEEKSRDWVHLEEAKEYYNGWKSGPGKESAHVQRLISGEARYDEWQEKPKETTEKRAATPEPRGRKRDREEEEEDYAADDEDARPRFSPFRPKKTSAKGLDGLLGRLSVSPPESPECPVKKSRKN
ncbi:hypothetical protein BDZ45DRAFT_253587 [Acephala macrosclerotiorum]|nr:hypothetical protein BDZ45DRAFT_253587 [Acephala macrosclerotiorum]